MKKSLILLLTAFLLLSAFAQVCAEEGVALSENLITRNGNLEDEEVTANGSPVGWNFFTRDYWSAHTQVVTTKAHSGTHSIYQKFDPADVRPNTGGVVKNLYATYQINVESGNTYKMQAWQSTLTNHSFMMVEFYNVADVNAANAYISGIKSDKFYSNTGVWTQAEYSFTVPDNAVMAVLYLGLSGDGEVWWDDLTCYMTQEKQWDVFTLDADYFYYTEWNVANFRIQHDSKHYTIQDGDTLEAAVFDAAGKAVWTQEDIPVTAEVSCNVPLAYLTERCVDYTLKVVYRDVNGNILQEQTHPIARVDRPSLLNDEGRIVIDAKEFIPNYGWSIGRSQEAMEYAKKLRYNVLTLSGYNLYSTAEQVLEGLDWYQENGFKAVLTLYYPEFDYHAVYYDTLRDIIPKIKEHPALLAYSLMDEPYNHKNLVDAATLREGYRMVRSLDAIHPVLTVENNPRAYQIPADASDILGYDPYQNNDKEIPNVMTYYTNQAIAAVDGKKPIWAVCRGYRTTDYDLTGNAIRYTLYETLWRGSDVSSLYNISAVGPTGGLYDDQPIWNRPNGIWTDSLYFSENELHLATLAFMEGKLPLFNWNVREGEAVFWISFVVGKDVHMLVFNRMNETVTVDIPLLSYDGTVQVAGYTAVPDGTTNLASIHGSRSLQVTLEPTRMQKFIIKPAVNLSFDKLTGSRIVDSFSYPWAKTAIDTLVNKNIVNRTGLRLYSPAQLVTRSEFAYGLVRALGIEPSETASFSDVSDTDYYAPEVAAGKEKGILLGDDMGKFHPNDYISRQDMMVMLARGMRIIRAMDEGDPTLLANMQDGASVADYAAADVAALLRDSVVKGNADGTINPLGNANRAESAVLLHRVLGWKEGG